jgi:hypothetical protein
VATCDVPCWFRAIYGAENVPPHTHGTTYDMGVVHDMVRLLSLGEPWKQMTLEEALELPDGGVDTDELAGYDEVNYEVRHTVGS